MFNFTSDYVEDGNEMELYKVLILLYDWDSP